MKRTADIVISLIGILFLLPVILIISIAIKITSKGPIIHWSNRVGKNNKIFKMPKFRTMKENTSQLPTHLVKDPQQHLTVIGPFLRRTSLDEVPQLWSILKGEMSFVGPRPALYNQTDLITLRTKLGIHCLLPGLTGWAQINGRDTISIIEKVHLDKEYVEKRSFLFDLYIFIKTFSQIPTGKNINH